MFNDLVKYIPLEFEVQVVSLNDIGGETYDEQAVLIAELVGQNDVVVVAESYSGPIAHALCGLLGNKLISLIFIASFIGPPSRISLLGFAMPTRWIRKNFLVRNLINFFGFNGRGAPAKIEEILNALHAVPVKVLKQRFKNISLIKVSDEIHDVACIYIRPAADRLVGSSAVDAVKCCYPNLNVMQIDGGHFIAQTSPKECAEVILDVLKPVIGARNTPFK